MSLSPSAFGDRRFELFVRWGGCLGFFWRAVGVAPAL